MRTFGKRDTVRAATLVEHGVITRDESCTTKTRYATQNDARHAAKLVARTQERRTATYRCTFCDGFHVTKLKHGEDQS